MEKERERAKKNRAKLKEDKEDVEAEFAATVATLNAKEAELEHLRKEIATLEAENLMVEQLRHDHDTVCGYVLGYEIFQAMLRNIEIAGERGHLHTEPVADGLLILEEWKRKKEWREKRAKNSNLQP